MSILFSGGKSRPYEFVHRGRPPTFEQYPGRGVLLLSPLDTHEELWLAACLEELRVPTALLPLPLAPAKVRLSLGDCLRLEVRGQEIPVQRLGAARYLCNLECPRPPGISQVEHDFDVSEWRTSLWTLRENLPIFWLNDPYRAGVSRLGVLELARSLGLRTPRTLVTNDPLTARGFRERVGPCVVKRVGHSFPTTPQGDIFPIFTRRLTLSDLAAPRLSACPVLIQEEIPKRCEYRVFVVGDEILPFRLKVGEALDWRELGAFAVERQPVRLSEDLEDRLRRLVRAYGLVYAALDLLEDRQGAIYFLELNPNGTYEFCDSLVRPRITERLARLLAAACR